MAIPESNVNAGVNMPENSPRGGVNMPGTGGQDRWKGGSGCAGLYTV